jgi:hypothetical protein
MYMAKTFDIWSYYIWDLNGEEIKLLVKGTKTKKKLWNVKHSLIRDIYP